MKINFEAAELPIPSPKGAAARIVKEFIDSGKLIVGIDPDPGESVLRVRSNLYEAVRHTNGLVSVYSADGKIFLTRNADPAAVVAEQEAARAKSKRGKKAEAKPE